jgi:hypothetical protein
VGGFDIARAGYGAAGSIRNSALCNLATLWRQALGMLEGFTRKMVFMGHTYDNGYNN